MPGYGWKGTPLYIPDLDDPRDVAEQSVEHLMYGFSTALAVRAYSGSWPGPGHLGTLGRALFSPSLMGSGAASNVARTSALADTMFALRVYSTPLRAVVRFAGPIGMLAWVGMELYEHRSTQRPGHEQRVADVQAWQDSIMPPPE